MNFTVAFSGNGANYSIDFNDGVPIQTSGRLKVYTKSGYEVEKMQTITLASGQKVGNWYTLSFDLNGCDGYSQLAGLVLWGTSSVTPLYLKNLRVLDSFPTAKTAVNPLGFSTTDDTVTLTQDNKDGVDCIKATAESSGSRNVWFEDVMSNESTHEDFFLLGYDYIKFDIYYEAGDTFAFITKWYDCGHNCHGTWIDYSGDNINYFRIYDSDGNRVNNAPVTGQWYTVYYKVERAATNHVNAVQFAFQEAVESTVYFANLGFATAFPDANA